MSKLTVLNMCLSDIPKESRRTAGNGKTYCDIVVTELKNTDDRGNTLTVYMSQSQQERTGKRPKDYIGRGKEFAVESKFNSNSGDDKKQFDTQNKFYSGENNNNNNNADDLPF